MTLERHLGDRLSAFSAAASRIQTPCLVVDLAVIRQRYVQLDKAFPTAAIYYAVKANPSPEVIGLVRDHGGCFDIASRYELDKVMGLGVSPTRVSFGNTIKKARDIAYFYEKGVRLFATDSASDLAQIAEHAPGAQVYVRVLTEDRPGADWPLSRKFGCEPKMAIDLIKQARALGLYPRGVSFHVGSQQRDLEAWGAALDRVKMIFDAAWQAGIALDLINLGGGLPGNYINPTPELRRYADVIEAAITERFPHTPVKLIMEPGRYLVADAGVLVTEVVLVSRKDDSGPRWVYVDAGKFGGLIETLDESIKYPIYTNAENPAAAEPVILAGPTCDSADILYEKHQYPMPLSLKSGDHVYFVGTGAYTTSYSAVEFNGFPPLASFYYDSEAVKAVSEADKAKCAA